MGSEVTPRTTYPISSSTISLSSSLRSSHIPPSEDHQHPPTRHFSPLPPSQELPSNHQYVQPKKIKVGSKKSKKSSGARSELVEEGKDGDNYTLSNIGRMLSPFSAKRKRREKNKTQKRR